MRAARTVARGGVVAAGAWAIVVALELAGAAQPARPPLPAEPLGKTGEALYPAFEGWGPLKDGSIVMLLGYYNRNTTQSFDIPVGPNNRIEPGGPDYGQPTHFDPRQSHGIFAIAVPKDFGTRKLTWTLTVNGHTTSVSFWANPPYWLDFYKNAATLNEPPVIRLAPDGPWLTGPPVGIAQTLTARVDEALPLKLWATDVPEIRPGADDELAEIRGRGRVVDPVAIVGGQTFGGVAQARGRVERPDVVVTWKVHRGPGPVRFASNPVSLFTKRDPTTVVEASSSATFTVPGEYVLRAQVNDESGADGGGDQCCWTNALVKVTVK